MEAKIIEFLKGKTVHGVSEAGVHLKGKHY